MSEIIHLEGSSQPIYAPDNIERREHPDKPQGSGLGIFSQYDVAAACITLDAGRFMTLTQTLMPSLYRNGNPPRAVLDEVMHRVRVQLIHCPEDKKRESESWLRARNLLSR